MDKKSAEHLLRRYLSGQCSPEERRLVESWYQEISNGEIQQDKAAFEGERLKNDVWRSIQKKRTRRIPWSQIMAAAVALFAITVGIYVYQQRDISEFANEHTAIQPGGNRAMLTLADGTEIDLDEDQEGVVIGADITYLDGSSLMSLPQPDLRGLTIATPRGGQYRVILPDGTQVWLNAETTLEYALQPEDHERVATLIGEAYFDVSNRYGRGGEKTVFKVKTLRQEVTVLGTGFNVSAYEASPQTITTLVQGRVRVADVTHKAQQRGGTWVLDPGFQAITSDHRTETAPANLASAIGWKNGDFVFDGSSIQEIMEQLSRWYDIDVQYRGRIPREVFGGKIARSKDIRDVLHVLELTGGVTFTIENRTIIVNP